MKMLVGSILLMRCTMWGQAPVERVGSRIDLPTSKQINGVVPGGPQQLGSLPVTMAVSPDGRWVVTVNGGFGSYESKYAQSLSVLDTQTGKVVEYPDLRTVRDSPQVLFSGLAFSRDGMRLYGSIASLTDPEGKKSTGSGVQMYSFWNGVIAAEQVMKIAPEKLPPGKTTLLGKNPASGIPYPAAIALVAPKRVDPATWSGIPGAAPGDRLLVAGNLSDDVTLLDARNGAIEKRFDVSESAVVPGTYPIAVAASRDGTKGYVALWNASEVVELDLVKGVVGRRLALLKPKDATQPGSHPVALELATDGKTMYAALSNRDAVAAIDLAGDRFALKGYFDARLPGQSFYGAQPEALALSADGTRLYVADMGADAVAVLDTRKLTRRAVEKGMVEPEGFLPTEWLPMAVRTTGGKLYVATGKGTGTGPNNFAQRPTPETARSKSFLRNYSYIPTLLHGSLAAIDEKTVDRDLHAMTETVLTDNRMRAAAETIPWNPAVKNGANPGPIKHVIYIIRENRTYDQILGDLTFDGKPIGNGDRSLTMYGNDITPNFHKLVLQFGIMDNFYDSAEVSGDGHVWSNSAIGTDYLERTWQLNYRGRQHGYDYEGVVSEGIPLEQGIADVNEPQSGYLWGNVARHGLSLYHFGEFISSTFCTDKGVSARQADPTQGPMLEGRVCTRSQVKPGETFPAVWGGGVNRWPWPVPLLAANKATKPELVSHFAPEFPDFNLSVPDQVRADIFLKHFEGWVADRKAGNDTMPSFIMLRIANDHTAGTKAGGPTPSASIADNDLAIGRVVEAVSHSAYWENTAVFVLEDDAQNGADHVDAHRSVALIASKYAPRTASGAPFVDSRFYSTVSMVRTMETVLGLPPMTNNDALSSLMSPELSGPGDQAPFVADRANEANGLIFAANKPSAPGAKTSAKMDFRHADRADAMKLNVILWQDAMGAKPVPALLTTRRKKKKDADDD